MDMRSVLEIVVFFTLVDTRVLAEEKETAIREMLESAMENSGESFAEEKRITKQYEILSYSIEHLRVELRIKKDELMENSYIPHLVLEVFLEQAYFERENVEAFLNTITRFFSGTFRDEYFVDHDDQYAISTMNSGKRYSLDDIKSLNIHEKDTEENKKLLDSLLYLHYTLERNIQNIFSLEQEVGSLVADDGTLTKSLNLSMIRTNVTKENLIKNLLTLHEQIEIVLHYFR